MEKPILYVNACVRKESRTRILAEKLLSKLGRPFEEIQLEEIPFTVSNEEYLNKRNQLISEGDLGNSMFDLARDFSKAETIVIAAPYWDLSFLQCSSNTWNRSMLWGLPSNTQRKVCRLAYAAQRDFFM